MSPTPSDDLLVRDLYERADRALPAMALDPADVLLASRRHRRRQTAVRSAAGVLAVGAFAVGATQIWAGEPDPTLPAGVEQTPRPMGHGQTVELAPGVVAANRPVEMMLDDGTPVLDLGLTAPGLGTSRQELVLAVATDAELADLAALYDTSRYDSGVVVTGIADSAVEPLRSQDSSGADRSRGWMVAWRQPTARDVGRPLGDVDLSTTGVSYSDDGSQVNAGAVPPWLPDPRVVVFSNQGYTTADGSTVRALELPTFTGPTDDHRLLYTLRIDASQGFTQDDPETGGQMMWDAAEVVLFVGSDGETVLGGQCVGQTFNECSANYPRLSEAVDLVLANDPQTSGDAGDTLSIQVAQDVHEVDSEEGRVVDLGIPVAGGDPLDEGRTYSLRAGVLVDGNAGTPDITGLWLDSLDPDGAPTTIAGSGGSGSRGGGGTVDEALTPANRNPIWMSMLGDHEAYMVGVRPPALEGATFGLLIERDSGEQVTPIPTFRVPGLDADVWFVVLTDPEVTYRDWPTTTIVVTAPDGSTSLWGLDSAEPREAVPEAP